MNVYVGEVQNHVPESVTLFFQIQVIISAISGWSQGAVANRYKEASVHILLYK